MTTSQFTKRGKPKQIKRIILLYLNFYRLALSTNAIQSGQSGKLISKNINSCIEFTY